MNAARPSTDGGTPTGASVPVVPRLNFGCGDYPAAGWLNANLKPGPDIDLAGDIRDGLPIASAALRYIASMHAICELPYLDVVPALRELRRVLEPGGVLRLGLPDFDRAIAAYTRGDRSYFSIPDDETPSLAGKLAVQLTWYGTNLMIFNAELADELLRRAGFEKIAHCGYHQTASQYAEIVELDNRPKETFFVEAEK